MNITVITPPPYEPVSLADVYRILRVDPDDDNSESPAVLTHPMDVQFQRDIKSAREKVEADTKRSLILQTLRLSMGGITWPYILYRRIILYRPPIVRVNSVKYFDGDNVLQTISPSNYYLTDEEVPELRFVSGFSVPTLYDRPDALRVEYVAGYDPAGSPPDDQASYAAGVPESLKNAVLVGVQLAQTSVSPSDFEVLTKMRAALIGGHVVHQV